MKKMALLVSVAFLAPACGGNGGGGTPDAAPQITGTCEYFVSNSLDLPGSQGDVDRLGIDLDGSGDIDNQLGTLISTLQGFSDIQGNVDAQIAAGDLVLLHRLHANDFASDDSVLWQTYNGNSVPPADPDPAFDGTDTFTVAATSPTDAKLFGGIFGGVFSGGPGTISLALPLTDPPTVIDLIGVQIEEAPIDVTSDPNEITGGRLGGALTQEDLNTIILPGVATSLTASCAGDPVCVTECADPNLTAHTLACTAGCGLMDSGPSGNMDCIVTVDEIQGSIAGSLLTPDCDLLDANGNPGQDGANDSLGLGVGITAVAATFDRDCPATE